MESFELWCIKATIGQAKHLSQTPSKETLLLQRVSSHNANTRDVASKQKNSHQLRRQSPAVHLFPLRMAESTQSEAKHSPVLVEIQLTTGGVQALPNDDEGDEGDQSYQHEVIPIPTSPPPTMRALTDLVFNSKAGKEATGG